MVLFNNIPYKRMRLTNKVSLTKCFSEKYKRMHLITRLYSIITAHFRFITAQFTYYHYTLFIYQCTFMQ